MWRPRSYAEVQAAIGVIAEDSQLDFKSALSTPQETAKDIGSFAIEGGVIAYGVDEQNGLASGITHVPLAQTPERIQQIVDTRIRPVPAIEIDVFEAPGGADGVVIVTVLPSPLAPHYANERYPARSGVTTRYLTEPEISALYEQRRRITESATGSSSILSSFLPAEGGPDGQSGVGGIGIMRLLVEPLATVRHPLGARVASALVAAVAESAITMSAYVASHLTAKAFDWLKEWRPRGALGWQAGHAANDHDRLAQGVLVAATYTHAGSFSFQASMSLAGESGEGRVAFEHLWLTELMACLCIAGTFHRDVPGVALVTCELGLQGLEGAVSYKASRGRAFVSGQPQVAEANYNEAGQFGARVLSADPREPADLLVDRLFASFLDERDDIVADVGRGAPGP